MATDYELPLEPHIDGFTDKDVAIGLKFHFYRWVHSTAGANWISSGYLNLKIPLEDTCIPVENLDMFGIVK
jgi:hypothetical protein